MKKTTIYIFFVFAMNISLAQKRVFIDGGLSLFAGSDTRSRNVTFLPAFTIFPGVNFFQSKAFTVNAGLPISAGVSYEAESDNLYIGADAPLALTFGFGSAFNYQSPQKFGFFIGGGVGYHYCHNKTYDFDNVVVNTTLQMKGILFHTGFTLDYDKQNPGGIAIRFSWLSQYPEHNKNVIGLGLIAWGKL